MFWRYGFSAVSPVDTLLEKESFTLEELLDEDEVLQECKQMNPKLIDFIQKDDVLEVLLKYVLTLPLETDSEKRKFKYPYVASEILSSDVSSLVSKFVKTDSLMNTLMSFLDEDGPLNPLLAGYFGKVLSQFMQSNPQEVLVYVKEKGDFLERVVHHVGMTSVMEFLMSLIQADEQQSSEIIEWIVQSQLVSMLISQFENPQADDETHYNAAEVLVSIIHRFSVQTFSMPSPCPLITLLVSNECVDRLLNAILSDSKALLEHGIVVLIEMVDRNRNPAHGDNRSRDTLPPLFSAIFARLPEFAELLNKGPKIRLETTFGVLDPPVGAARIKVMELLAALIRANHHCIETELMRLNVFSTCLDLMFKYEWNNFLQHAVEDMMVTILEGSCDEVRLALFRSCQLTERLLKAHADNNEVQAQENGIRRGYMGHVIRIANHVVRAAMAHRPVRMLLEENSDWNEYVDDSLAQCNKIETTYLGGHVPRGLSSQQTSDDEGNDRSSFDLQLANQLSDVGNEGGDWAQEGVYEDNGFDEDFPTEYDPDDDPFQDNNFAFEANFEANFEDMEMKTGDDEFNSEFLQDDTDIGGVSSATEKWVPNFENFGFDMESNSASVPATTTTTAASNIADNKGAGIVADVAGVPAVSASTAEPLTNTEAEEANAADGEYNDFNYWKRELPVVESTDLSESGSA